MKQLGRSLSNIIILIILITTTIITIIIINRNDDIDNILEYPEIHHPTSSLAVVVAGPYPSLTPTTLQLHCT